MSKTMKSLIGLSLVPVVIPFVGLLHLSRRRESQELCADFWRALSNDVRTVVSDRGFWAEVLTGLFVIINALAGCACLLTHNWSMAVINLTAACWLATRS